MELYHIIGLGLSAGIAITGALTGTAPILIPVGMALMTGIFAHMTPSRQDKSRNPS